jgi:nitrate reductase NapAB chaperone NapD
MPIGGFVINVRPDDREQAIQSLESVPKLEIEGSDEQGNVVAVIDTETSREMQGVIDQLNKIDTVLSVNLTYVNVEDEQQG